MKVSPRREHRGVCSHEGSAPLPVSLIGHMLQRDPKKRATLEQIESHKWLQGVDPSPATKLSTPLVSHRSLSEEEHGSIIQRMVLGGIADRDAITEYEPLALQHHFLKAEALPLLLVTTSCLHRFRALESNQYNHITATYFLLAERMLRERQEKEQHSQTRSPSPSKAQFRYTCTPKPLTAQTEDQTNQLPTPSVCRTVIQGS